MVGFIVFGIFNDSKKKKKKITDNSTEPVNKEWSDVGDVFREIFEGDVQRTPPPIPTKKIVNPKTPNPNREKRFKQSDNLLDGFESSLSLVTDFEGESSLKGYKFDMEVMEVIEDGAERYSSSFANSILSNFNSGDKQLELKKAIIYSEILNRKY